MTPVHDGRGGRAIEPAELRDEAVERPAAALDAADRFADGSDIRRAA
jgi:hypothetical protein